MHILHKLGVLFVCVHTCTYVCILVGSINAVSLDFVVTMYLNMQRNAI